MTRPLGYSVERQDDGRIALVHAERCWTCSGSGKVAHSWEVTCPDGCTFTASARPVSSLVRCRKCPGYWDSSEFKAVSVMGACWDCRGGAGMCCSMTLFEVEAARALRDALTAAMGETSEPCPRCAARDYMRDPDGFVEVPDASVASEGPAKGAGPSKRGLPTVAECADEDCDRCAGTGRIDNSDRGGALETCSCVVFCEVCHWPRRPMVYGSAPCGVCAGAP